MLYTLKIKHFEDCMFSRRFQLLFTLGESSPKKDLAAVYLYILLGRKVVIDVENPDSV